MNPYPYPYPYPVQKSGSGFMVGLLLFLFAVAIGVGLALFFYYRSLKKKCNIMTRQDKKQMLCPNNFSNKVNQIPLSFNGSLVPGLYKDAGCSSEKCNTCIGTIDPTTITNVVGYDKWNNVNDKVTGNVTTSGGYKKYNTQPVIYITDGMPVPSACQMINKI